MANVKILCPKCDWEPTPADRWSCSCGHAWHTFDTAGRCPACAKTWDQTQCLGPSVGGCTEWSAHLDWYRNLDEWVKDQVEKIKETEPAGA